MILKMKNKKIYNKKKLLNKITPTKCVYQNTVRFHYLLADPNSNCDSNRFAEIELL